MNGDERPQTGLPRPSPALGLRLAGAAILVAGGIFAATVFATTTPGETDGGVGFERTKVQEMQLERIGGKFLVQAIEIQNWFEGLWHGRRLAWTTLVLSAAAAGACFWIAGLASHGPASARRRRDSGDR